MQTTDEKLKAFRLELSQLLEKHGASIEWTCSEYSDLHGVYDDRLVLSIGNKGIKTEYNYIDARTLKEEIEE